MSKFLQHFVLSLLLFNLAACSSMQPVNIQTAMHSSKPRGIDYGSLVEVKTLDKRTAKFRVTDINQEGLGGSKGFFRYEEMKSLRVDNPEANNDTLNIILGAIGIIAIIVLAASSGSVSICSPSPCPEPQE